MTDTTISVRIDNDLREKMRAHNFINWSALIRNLLLNELKKYENVKKEKTKKALQEIKKIRASKIFDVGKGGVEIIREWRDKRKF